VNWFRDHKGLATDAVARSREALAEAESARESAKKSAEYLRKERAKNHWSDDVRAAWRERP
jgi:hypothetical protein